MASDVHEFTELLQAHARGDSAALDRLFPKVYDELRQMARGRMRHERADHTLGATGRVHGAFFRLVRVERLAQLEPRQAGVVECRLFGGLNLDETAEALGVSAATVSRDWTIARAWLHAELANGPHQ